TSNDGKNIVMFRNDGGTAIATTYWWANIGGSFIDADIIFHETYQHATSSMPCTGYYIQNTASHEFGHAIGMAHSDVASSTMYPSEGGCETSKESLDADDITGIQTIYPLNTGTPPPAPTPPSTDT